jgi:hypothetical protein
LGGFFLILSKQNLRYFLQSTTSHKLDYVVLEKFLKIEEGKKLVLGGILTSNLIRRENQ